MERGELTALYVIGENPANSEADQHRAAGALRGLEILVVQDMVLTADRRAGRRGAAGRRRLVRVRGHGDQQRAPRAAGAPGPAAARRGASTTSRSSASSPAASAATSAGTHPTAEELWDEVRSSQPGARRHVLRAPGGADGLQWPCYDETHPGESYLHGRLWERPVVGPRAPFSCVDDAPPIDELSDEFPLRLTTGRRLDSYNTGVQTGSTLRRCGAARPSTSTRRTRGGSRGRRGRGGAGGVAARRGARAGALRRRPAPRPRLHDLPLPRPGGDQRADHRRGRSALRHLGVQGDGGAGGEGRARGLPRGERGGGPGARRCGAGDCRSGGPRRQRSGAGR